MKNIIYRLQWWLNQPTMWIYNFSSSLKENMTFQESLYNANDNFKRSYKSYKDFMKLLHDSKYPYFL
jgi:hypothetical protein